MPTITCQKQFTLTVLSPISITAYWTLNEALGSVDRIDSVTALHLFALGITMPGAPALISNGVEFTALFGGSGYGTLGTPQLAYVSPNSWSAWGWFKIVSQGIGNFLGGPSIGFSIGTGTAIGIYVGDSTKVQPIIILAGADEADIACTIGSWHFFHLCYNGSTGKYGYSIDNAAITYLPTVVGLTNAATGGVSFARDWTDLGSPVGDVIFDEVGVVTNAMLSLAQQTYLYNGGAGRTWPIVLP